MTRSFVLALSSVLIAAGSAAAEPVAVRVAYSTAELARPDGAAAVAARIRIAARKACGGDDPVVASGSGFQACQQRTVERAARDLGAPLVAEALGRGHTVLAGR